MPSRILRINVQLEAMKKILITRSLGSLVDVSTFLISSESNEKKKRRILHGSTTIFLGDLKTYCSYTSLNLDNWDSKRFSNMSTCIMFLSLVRLLVVVPFVHVFYMPQLRTTCMATHSPPII
jgi:hypothetical protein